MSEPNQSLEEFLFEAALAKASAEERAAFLNGVCRDNPGLRVRLDVLLEGHFQAEGFLGVGPGRVEKKPAAPPAEDTSRSVGRYKLLEKIGEGGFGEVWMAEQREPVKRRVALKIIKLGMDTRQVVARFEGERQALAMMDHPNIAKVLEAGATDTGRPYFVMELVRGIRITEYCDANQLSTHERLKLFIPVCRAIQHAHQKGVIHRDIKPSNILVTLHDGVPVPKVIDFGIAKATQQELTEKTVFTQFRQFLGTPAYVSPEQAEMSGLDIDTRSDIYSLGVLLYELLTGRTPFDTQELLRAGLEGLRRIIRERQPLKPSTRLTQELSAVAAARQSAANRFKEDGGALPRRRYTQVQAVIRLLRGDLDWIVMKCLEKDRGRRYETANGLARDLERHLSNEPVAARPPSRVYEFRKTVRRHWVGFAAAGAILLAFALGAAISAWEAVRATAAQRYGQRLLYAANMNQAQTAWQQNHLGRVWRVLEETASYPDRGFEWYYWQRQLHLARATLWGHLSEVLAAAFSPDSRRAATGGQDGTVKIWDTSSGRELLSLNGKPVTGIEPIRVFGHNKGISQVFGKAILSVAFPPDGRRVAAGSVDSSARIWDAITGQDLLTLKGHLGPVRSIAFSRDGLRIITGSDDRTARIWDAATGQLLRALKGHTDEVLSVAFSPDGGRIATGSADGTARIWEASSGKPILTFTGHSNWVSGVAFPPDGGRLLTASDDQTAKIWDVTTGKELMTFKGHDDAVRSAAFFPDGRRVLTGSEDQTARVWDVATGLELFSLRGHTAPVTCVACSADGQWLLTGSSDHRAKIWEAAAEPGVTMLSPHDGGMVALAFSPDGQRIVSCRGDNTAQVCEATTGKELFTLRGHLNPVRAAAFFPDSRRIVTGSGDQTARVWDASSGAELFRLEGHTAPVTSVAVSPDGRRILSGSADNTAVVWDGASRKRLLRLTGHTESVLSVAFSSDGRRMVTGSADNTARIWDASSGRRLVTLTGHGNWIEAVAFSPDGRQILTGGDDRTARLWDATSGKELLKLEGDSDNVKCAFFSQDGRRVLTGSNDNSAKLWDAVSGKELLTLQGSIAALSPDSCRIATADFGNTARIWQAATSQQLVAWQGQEAEAGARLAALARDQEAEAQRQQQFQAQDPGMIREWLVIAPIRYEGQSGAQALAQQQLPDEANLRPRTGERIRVGTRQWGWRTVQLDDYPIDFLRLMKANPEYCVAYAVSYVQSETNYHDILMKVGSDDQSKVYLNSQPVYQCDESRLFLRDQDARAVDLRAGLNVVVFKVANETDYWQGSIHFTDSAGRPLKGIHATITPARAEDPGAISHWLVLAPIPFGGHDGARALARQQVPNEARLRPRTGDPVQVGGSTRAWRECQLQDYALDFKALSQPAGTDWSVAYAVCYLESQTDRSGLLMKIGSDDQAKVFVNGKVVYQHEEPRPFVPDQDEVSGIELKAGPNVLVFKVVNETEDWRGSIRLTDAAGEPVKGLRVILGPPQLMSHSSPAKTANLR
jgi:WD40 repeat protein/serine/threonine protein kinase